MYYTVIKHSGHLRTLEKCRKHLPAARVFYISLVLSNAHRVLSQCNTRLRLLYLLNISISISIRLSANQQALFAYVNDVLIKHKHKHKHKKKAHAYVYAYACVASEGRPLSVLPKNTKQCPWPRLKPGLLDP